MKFDLCINNGYLEVRPQSEKAIKNTIMINGHLVKLKEGMDVKKVIQVKRKGNRRLFIDGYEFDFNTHEWKKNLRSTLYNKFHSIVG